MPARPDEGLGRPLAQARTEVVLAAAPEERVGVPVTEEDLEAVAAAEGGRVGDETPGGQCQWSL